MADHARLLLDTNILLAALIAPETLPAGVQAQLCDPANSILFNPVCDRKQIAQRK